MPITSVYFFAEADGKSPVVEWLATLRVQSAKDFMKCHAAIQRLRDCGHELRRPTAAYLCEDLYELRVRCGHVNYRLLFFFHGRHQAVLVHAFSKEDVIPLTQINRARDRKRRFDTAPERHISQWQP